MQGSTAPDNRMAANVPGAEWNAKLRALYEAQHELGRRRGEPDQRLDDRQRQRILALANDFSRLWNDPAARSLRLRTATLRSPYFEAHGPGFRIAFAVRRAAPVQAKSAHAAGHCGRP